MIEPDVIERFKATWRKLQVAAVDLNAERDSARDLAADISGLPRMELNTWKLAEIENYISLVGDRQRQSEIPRTNAGGKAKCLTNRK